MVRKVSAMCPDGQCGAVPQDCAGPHCNSVHGPRPIAQSESGIGKFKWQATGSTELQLKTEHRCSAKESSKLSLFFPMKRQNCDQQMQCTRVEIVQVNCCIMLKHGLGAWIVVREKVAG